MEFPFPSSSFHGIPRKNIQNTSRPGASALPCALHFKDSCMLIPGRSACRVCLFTSYAARVHPAMLKPHSALLYNSYSARPVAPFRVHLLLHKSCPRRSVKAVQGSGSYDSDSDDLLREFQQYADPNKLQNATKRLELTWGVQRVCHWSTITTYM